MHYVLFRFKGEHHHEEELKHATGEKLAEGAAGEDTSAHHHHAHPHSRVDTHTTIGIALVVGFIFMLLVDQIGGGSHSHVTTGE